MLAVLLLNRMSMKRRVARKQRASKLSTIEVTLPKASDTLCCRTCLSTEQLEPLFSSKETAKKRSHELHLATGLKIKIDDCLSQKICGNCVDSLKTAIQFRRASRKAEKMLLDLIATEKPKKKYKLCRKVVKTAKVKTKTEKDTDDKYDVFVDIGYDDYPNDDSYNDDSYQNETYSNEVDESIVKEEVIETTVKKKPAAVKRKRTVIPNASSYKCNTCNKEFRMKATYKAHMRFHTNYCVCETCGKRCRNNNQLQEHKRARHGLGRIHKCAYCEYSSATKEALTIHERRHTGERPYVCDHCGATFHRRSNLVQHIAIHLPEKNFQCKICGKREKSKKLLAVHSYKAHRRSRYKYLCPLCRAVFSRPGNARQHLSRTHGVLRAEQGPIERVEITYSAVDTNFATLVLRQANPEHL